MGRHGSWATGVEPSDWWATNRYEVLAATKGAGTPRGLSDSSWPGFGQFAGRDVNALLTPGFRVPLACNHAAAPLVPRTTSAEVTPFDHRRRTRRRDCLAWAEASAPRHGTSCCEGRPYASSRTH